MTFDPVTLTVRGFRVLGGLLAGTEHCFVTEASALLNAVRGSGGGPPPLAAAGARQFAVLVGQEAAAQVPHIDFSPTIAESLACSIDIIRSILRLRIEMP